MGSIGPRGVAVTAETTGQDQAEFIKSFKSFVLFMFANLPDLALLAASPPSMDGYVSQKLG